MTRRWDAGEPLDDVSPGRWLEERLWTWGSGSGRQGVNLGCLVPAGFEAYARVLHPALRWTEHGLQPVRWSEVASQNGTTVHPLMHFHRIARIPWPQDPDWGSAPPTAALPTVEGDRLVKILRSFTATPDNCYLALWEGYGVSELNALAGRPQMRLTARNYFLFEGPIGKVMWMSIGDYWQPPNIWWPKDQAWCVATEIDSDSTYIGGSQRCIERVLGDAELEAFPIAIDARIDHGGDIINPRP